MPVAVRAGQVLMVGLDARDGTDPSGVVGRYHLGGVILHGRSSRSMADLAARVRTLQAAAGQVPLHVSVDQEGGKVQALTGRGFPRMPSAVDQGRLGPAALRRLTIDWARRLAGAGITLNLAPVADTVPAGTAAANRPIGASQRNYDVLPARVGADVATVVGAARQAGVQSTLKHFPGLGRVRANTDTSTRATDPVADANDPYLAPFRSGIAAGAAAVMISLATYPRLDTGTVAVFSAPIVTGLLRGRLGFRGLVVSDDLGRAEAVRAVPPGQRAVRFLRAGGDLVLTVRTADAAVMSAALVAAAGRDRAFARRLADAARHVLASKQSAGLLRC
jgi:beta-N-acetylhexosaminidase